MKTLSLKLSDELDASVSALAKRRKTTKSDVIRNALKAYLSGQNSAQKQSFMDRAGNIIGSLEGPADLSHNKDHMKGYGQ